MVDNGFSCGAQLIKGKSKIAEVFLLLHKFSSSVQPSENKSPTSFGLLRSLTHSAFGVRPEQSRSNATDRSLQQQWSLSVTVLSEDFENFSAVL